MQHALRQGKCMRASCRPARSRPGVRTFLASVCLAVWTLPSSVRTEVHPDWVFGDCNQDRRVDIVDSISALFNIYGGPPVHICLHTCDVSRDGALSLVDPIALLSHIFRGQALPLIPPSWNDVSDTCGDGEDNDCDARVDEDCGLPSGRITIAWDAVTRDVLGSLESVQGYRVYIGVRSRRYDLPIDVGNVLEFTIDGLISGRTYYMAVTAYDEALNESSFSAELRVVVP